MSSLEVLYLERTELDDLPPSAAPTLRRLRLLSLDFFTFIESAAVLCEARQLHSLYLYVQHVEAEQAELEAAVDALRNLQAPAGSLKHVCIVVRTTEAEALTVSGASLLLMLGGLAPGVRVSSMDADKFFGLKIEDLEGEILRIE
ncbi:hypothetical protein N2152v2_000319 [Parachlorella kessleri]